MMENRNSWIDDLNITPAQLESWKEEAPGDVPMLVWALREGKISFDAYAAWAKRYYELAVVRHEFFTHATPPAHAEVDQWTPWMVPVSQWESVTFVGCVMPPPDPEEGLVYVLAHPRDLETVYAKLSPSSMDVTMDSIAADLPLPPEMPAGLSAQAPKASGFTLNIPGISSDEPAAEPSQVLDIEYTKTGVKLTGPAPELNPPAPTVNDGPSGLSTAAPTGFTLNLNLPGMSSSEPSAPPEVPAPEVISTEEENLMTSVTQMTGVTQMSEPAPSPHVPSAVSAEHGDQWWALVSQTFAHAMILDASTTQFTLIWKDGQALDGSVSFPASQPSLFRIAQRTQKPYHGFVVENEIHSAFFKHLGIETYPNTVTAIAVKGQVIVLFGAHGSLESELNEAEKLVAQFEAPSKSAQAA